MIAVASRSEERNDALLQHSAWRERERERKRVGGGGGAPEGKIRGVGVFIN